MDVVVGLGETGRPLYNILKAAYPDTIGFDLKGGFLEEVKDASSLKADILHICIPYHEGFVDTIKKYQVEFDARATVVHSTVPIGTTREIGNAVHSPILGRHYDMEVSLKKFQKWVGGDKKMANLVAMHFVEAGMWCKVVDKSEETEALKLLCLAKYGMSIAFAQYQKEIADTYGFDYQDISKWDMMYNNGVFKNLQRPVLMPPGEKIGGHCIVQNTKLLNEQHPNQILEEIIKFDGSATNDPVIWEPANVYKSVKLGKNVSIGMFSEVGNKVEIGDGTRVGKGSFIPEGVKIGKDVFIGPHVCFTNDRYPPSRKKHWQETIVEDGASIGANVTIVCGVTIGKGAMIGAGAVVSKDVPPGERWMGVPAKNMNVGVKVAG